MSGPIKLWGETYRNVEHVADTLRLPLTAFEARCRLTNDVEESALHYLKTIIHCAGEQYIHYCEIASEYGISPDTLYYRIRNGWALEVAARTPISIRINPAQYIVYDQQEYTSKAVLCSAYGITTTLVYSTMNSYKLEGWIETFDLIIQFLKSCPGNRPKLVTKIPYIIYNNVWCDTAKAFCNECGITYASYCAGRSTVPAHTPPLVIMRKMYNSPTLRKKYPTFRFDPHEPCQNVLSDFREYIQFNKNLEACPL